MNDQIRRLYNKVEGAFDRGALLNESRSLQELEGSTLAKTASAVFSSVLTLVRQFDRSAKLKMIVAPDGTNNEGVAYRWEFLFDLPQRRAKLECNWFLRSNNDRNQDYTECVEIIARPFPPADHAIRKMVEEGKLIYPQLKGVWRKERGRTPDLPHSFRNSDVALAELIRQGLTPSDMEFSLATGTEPGRKLSWVAQTRSQNFYTSLI